MISSVFLIGVFLVTVRWFAEQSAWMTAAGIPCVIIAGLFATNFFEPAALAIAGSQDTIERLRFEADFICFVTLFAAPLAGMQKVISAMSDLPILPDRFELQSRPWLAAIASYLVMSITLTACDTSPGLRSLMSLKPDEAAFFGIVSPDSQWLSFAAMIADGSLSRPLPNASPSSTVGLRSKPESGGRHIRSLRQRYIDLPSTSLKLGLSAPQP